MTENKQKIHIAKELGMEILFSCPSSVPSGVKLRKKIPYSFVRKNLILPLEEHETHIVIALADPLNLNALEELKLIIDKPFKAFFLQEEKILTAINDYYHHQEGETSRFLENLPEEAKETKGASPPVDDLLEMKEEAPIIRLLNLILSEAIQQGASDIHFEPFENDLKIRYRIDGVLQPRHAPPRETQAKLLTRIKVLAKLDIAEHRLPQDGRIKLRMGGKEVDFRVSTVPVIHGERIVLRIHDKTDLVLGLDQLGMLPKTLDILKELISLPEGIILVTGPTGSGKTTTLYSILWEICRRDTNIMTIEDPVESKLKGIAQIPTHAKIGLTFAKGLRHILRQDPDTIMIGEIRDTETAEIAIQAALTGHQVFSTLHTNDAPSTIVRLIDMGVEAYLLSSTIVAILAQRLVRKICPHCREKYSPSLKEREELNLKHLDCLYRGRGCSQCFSSGYRGRHGVYELLPISDTLQTLIAKSSHVKNLRNTAKKEGFMTLREHGAHLALTGITTVTEVLRVSKKY